MAIAEKLCRAALLCETIAAIQPWEGNENNTEQDQLATLCWFMMMSCCLLIKPAKAGKEVGVVSLGFTWSDLVSLGFACFHLVLLDFTCSHQDSFAFTRRFHSVSLVVTWFK